MGKYSLTEGMNQDQIRTAMEAAVAMSNYYQTGRGITASSNLNNALIKQSYDQQKYNQRGQIGGLVQGIGTGLLKGGLTSLFSLETGMADNNPLAYMGAGMKIGQSIGGSSGAASRSFARALALKQVGMQTEIKKHGIKNGFGIKRKEGKLVFDENLYSNSNERSVGLQSFLKTENEEASKVFAQNTKDLVAIEKALGMATKSKNTEMKGFYGSIMQRHINHLGMKVDANDVLSGIKD